MAYEQQLLAGGGRTAYAAGAHAGKVAREAAASGRRFVEGWPANGETAGRREASEGQGWVGKGPVYHIGQDRPQIYGSVCRNIGSDLGSEFFEGRSFPSYFAILNFCARSGE